MNEDTTFRATFFSGNLTAAIPIHVQVAATQWILRSDDGEQVREFTSEDVSISDRLANTPRLVLFADGSSLESTANSTLDQLAQNSAGTKQKFSRLVHLLESHSKFAAIATALVVAAVVSLYTLGLPRLAESVALNLPDQIETEIGKASLRSFNAFGGVTGLSLTERSRAHLQLERVLLPAETSPELHLRNIGALPNAFALPGYHIVATDALLRLLNDDEVAAVMAHEMGHLTHRHAEQQILLGSTSLLLIAATTGDLSILTSFAAALPLSLLQSGYSREFEKHADALAVERLVKVGIPPEALIDALMQLETSLTGEETNNIQFSYLSTHPTNEERFEYIRETARAIASIEAPQADPTPAD